MGLGPRAGRGGLRPAGRAGGFATEGDVPVGDGDAPAVVPVLFVPVLLAGGAVEGLRLASVPFVSVGEELAGVTLATGAGAAGFGGASLVEEGAPVAAVVAEAVESAGGFCDFSETRSPSALSPSRRSAGFFEASSLRSPCAAPPARALSSFFGAGASVPAAALSSAAGPTRTPSDWKTPARAPGQQKASATTAAKKNFFIRALFLTCPRAKPTAGHGGLEATSHETVPPCLFTTSSASRSVPRALASRVRVSAFTCNSVPHTREASARGTDPPRDLNNFKRPIAPDSQRLSHRLPAPGCCGPPWTDELGARRFDCRSCLP